LRCYLNQAQAIDLAEREASTSKRNILIYGTFIAYVKFGATISYQQSALLPDQPVRRL
jgi:hypothetical protein